MATLLSHLSYAFRQAALADGVTLSTGHAQQLLAAALGHKSLASLQSSDDLANFGDAQHLLFDGELLSERAQSLGIQYDDVVDDLWAVLEGEFEGTMHSDVEHLLEAHQEYVDREAWDDPTVGSEMAMTNGTGPGDVWMPLEAGGLTDADFGLEVEVIGHVKVDQDPDKVFWGTYIDVQATFILERVGSRLFGNPQLKVHQAKLRWFDEGPEDLVGDEEVAETTLP